MDQRKAVEFQARATIVLNGREQYLIGRGNIDSKAGIVNGSYHHNVPANDFDALVFQTVLVTGYPSVCREDDSLRNPFLEGDYHYDREIDFGANGRMRYTADCRLVEHPYGFCLNSEFNVQTELSLPRLKGALPLVERWTPASNGIHAQFAIVWPTLDGRGQVVGRATTIYQIPSGAQNISEPLIRDIAFRHARSAGDHLEIIQESSLSRQ